MHITQWRCHRFNKAMASLGVLCFPCNTARVGMEAIETYRQGKTSRVFQIIPLRRIKDRESQGYMLIISHLSCFFIRIINPRGTKIIKHRFWNFVGAILKKRHRPRETTYKTWWWTTILLEGPSFIFLKRMPLEGSKPVLLLEICSQFSPLCRTATNPCWHFRIII
jgi:hypothetical protein